MWTPCSLQSESFEARRFYAAVANSAGGDPFREFNVIDNALVAVKPTILLLLRLEHEITSQSDLKDR